MDAMYFSEAITSHTREIYQIYIIVKYMYVDKGLWFLKDFLKEFPFVPRGS